MMRSLVQVLDQKIENWREKYVISIDNCRIHHSNDVNELIKKYRIPVIFSAPATPQILPIENFFSLEKRGEIFKQEMKTGKK